jgi:hypothetical protein
MWTQPNWCWSNHENLQWFRWGDLPQGYCSCLWFLRLPEQSQASSNTFSLVAFTVQNPKVMYNRVSTGKDSRGIGSPDRKFLELFWSWRQIDTIVLRCLCVPSRHVEQSATKISTKLMHDDMVRLLWIQGFGDFDTLPLDMSDTRTYFHGHEILFHASCSLFNG